MTAQLIPFPVPTRSKAKAAERPPRQIPGRPWPAAGRELSEIRKIEALLRKIKRWNV